jgi:hypothetical protein
LLASIPNRIYPGKKIERRKILKDIILGLTLDQFIDFVYSYNHQIDREDQNREIFLILDRTCKRILIDQSNNCSKISSF